MGPKKIMIVDDISFVRQTIRRMVTAHHYHVVGEAENGRDAVRLYQEVRPDIVTMDIVMPEMSGIEATQAIVRADKNALVVIVSAMGQETLAMESINVGARDFLLKPFDSEGLLKTLERVLALSQTLGGFHVGHDAP